MTSLKKTMKLARTIEENELKMLRKKGALTLVRHPCKTVNQMGSSVQSAFFQLVQKKLRESCIKNSKIPVTFKFPRSQMFRKVAWPKNRKGPHIKG
jgi:hypothetical protein